MKVKNFKSSGSHYRKLSGGSLNKWKEYKGYNDNDIIYCSNNDCINKAEVGGHVKKCNSDDNRVFITPLCYNCNNDHNLEFNVDKDNLVPLNEL